MSESPALYYDTSLLPVVLKNPYNMSKRELMMCFSAFANGTFTFYSIDKITANVSKLVMFVSTRLTVTSAPERSGSSR
jgi:hypothetical protein